MFDQVFVDAPVVELMEEFMLVKHSTMGQDGPNTYLGSIASATCTNRVSSSVCPFSSFPQAEASLSPAVQIELVRKMSF